MKKRKKRTRNWKTRIGRMLLRLALLSAAAFLLVTIGPTLLLRWIDPPATAFMARYAVQETLAKRALTLPKYQWVDWGEISPNAALAVIASEDQKFPVHNGFDIDSMTDALEDHLEGGPLRGASTISQQTAKNLFLWPGRSLGRKALEAWMTVWLEVFCPKQRILEIYLNIAEFGKGVYGIEAAANMYFKRKALRLSQRQSALLAAVLPSPKKRSPVRPSAYVRKKAAWIRDQMHQLGGTAYLKKLENSPT
jgi:monofunctional biosynthetic peptidoglycan transglycosylase